MPVRKIDETLYVEIMARLRIMTIAAGRVAKGSPSLELSEALAACDELPEYADQLPDDISDKADALVLSLFPLPGDD